MATNTEYLGLTSAALRFNIDGKYVSATTVWRWMRHGVNCGGHCIHLGHVRMGRRLATTPQFIDEFMRALANADHDESLSQEREAARSRPVPHARLGPASDEPAAAFLRGPLRR
jgi:hypothetical protein